MLECGPHANWFASIGVNFFVASSHKVKIYLLYMVDQVPYTKFSLLPYFAWYYNESKIYSLYKIKDCGKFIKVGHDNLYMFC